MKSLKIGAHDVVLKLPHKFQNEKAMALVDLDQKEIMIDSRGPDGELRPLSVVLVSLFHEIFHIVDYQGGFKLFGDAYTEDDTPEGCIDSFAESMVQVLLDNNLLNHKFLNDIKRQAAQKI